MPAEVADASVLGAFLFREPLADRAALLLEGKELFEPELLAYELASVARKKALRHADLRDTVLAALRLGLALAIHWVQADHAAVVELALETGLTTYDASYLHLSRSLEVPLVTFDEKLRRAVLDRSS